MASVFLTVSIIAHTPQELKCPMSVFSYDKCHIPRIHPKTKKAVRKPVLTAIMLFILKYQVGAYFRTTPQFELIL